MSGAQNLTVLWTDVERVTAEMEQAVAAVVNSSVPEPGLLTALITDLQRLQKDCELVQHLSLQQEQQMLPHNNNAATAQQQQQQQQPQQRQQHVVHQQQQQGLPPQHPRGHQQQQQQTQQQQTQQQQRLHHVPATRPVHAVGVPIQQQQPGVPNQHQRPVQPSQQQQQRPLPVSMPLHQQQQRVQHHMVNQQQQQQQPVAAQLLLVPARVGNTQPSPNSHRTPLSGVGPLQGGAVGGAFGGVGGQHQQPAQQPAVLASQPLPLSLQQQQAVRPAVGVPFGATAGFVAPKAEPGALPLSVVPGPPGV